MEENNLSIGAEARGKPFLPEAPGGEKKREKSVNNCGRVATLSMAHGETWEKDAILSFVRFGKLAKSRAIDGCTPAPFLRWYHVSRGT